MTLSDKNISYILIAIIFILGAFILFTCSKSKSPFGETSTITTSPSAPIADDSVLIFYAPWCGYCKKSMDEFKDAVARGRGKVVLIDATEDSNKKLKESFPL